MENGEREKPLTHNTIRRLRLLRWILKDPRDYYFFLFFHFHSSIIISEERMGARSRPRIQCAFITCVHVHVYVYTCLYTYSLIPGWARLGLGWMRGNHGRLWVGSLVSRRDYRRVLKLIVTEVTSGQRQWPEREWRQREREPSDKKRRGIEW